MLQIIGLCFSSTGMMNQNVRSCVSAMRASPWAATRCAWSGPRARRISLSTTTRPLRTRHTVAAASVTRAVSSVCGPHLVSLLLSFAITFSRLVSPIIWYRQYGCFKFSGYLEVRFLLYSYLSSSFNALQRWPTKVMEQSPFWESVLVYFYHVHKFLALIQILSQMNLVDVLSPVSLKPFWDPPMYSNVLSGLSNLEFSRATLFQFSPASCMQKFPSFLHSLIWTY